MFNVLDNKNRRVASVDDISGELEEAEANAELIVRAVNCHEELVKEVERFYRYVQKLSAESKDDPYRYVLDLDILEHLLKRARGES